MNSAIKYGLITASLAAAHKMVLFFTESQLTRIGVYSNILVFILILIFVFLGIKHKRNKELNGIINFKGAMKQGLGIAVIAGIVFASFIYLYYGFIDAGFAEKLAASTREAMINKHINPEKIDLEMKRIREQIFPPFRQATFTLLLFTITGIVCSLISSTFLSKQDPDPSQ